VLAVLFIGCFHEDQTHDLKVDQGPLLSTSACGEACAGYKYFALQGDGCRCGPHYQTAGRYKPIPLVSNKECGPECEGEEGLEPPRLCGLHDKHEWRNAIYRRADWVDPSPLASWSRLREAQYPRRAREAPQQPGKMAGWLLFASLPAAAVVYSGWQRGRARDAARCMEWRASEGSRLRDGGCPNGKAGGTARRLPPQDLL
jgi:hypothetical protein